MCDYSRGFVKPEMVKKRPAVIMTPSMARRPNLCAVVPLSTTEPETIMPYNMQITLPFALPHPFDSRDVWLKGDMINAVSFDRLDLFRIGKDHDGKRRYFTKALDSSILKEIQKCVLHGLNLSRLTPYL